MSPSDRPSTASSHPVEPLAAHYKVVLLGICLLASCGAVAAVGMWGVTTIQRNRSELVRHEGPALGTLLQIDRDLNQAELGLERATRTTDIARRNAALAFYDENVLESAQRFDLYKTLAVNTDNEIETAADYLSDRAKWFSAAEELKQAVSNPVNTPERSAWILDQYEKVQDLFDRMREHINLLAKGIYQPAIDSSVDRSDRDARLTCWTLIVSFVVALFAGVVLTRNMSRTLRIQRQAADRMNVEREEQNRHQSFEARLSRGLEMMQDEPSTLRMVEEAIAAVAPSVSAEILLADSSRAHLQQAASTAPSGKQGCMVARPSDCPAVRRGHRLNFRSSVPFDVCPHLKGRSGGNCSAVCIPLSIMGQAVGVLHATGADGFLPPEDQILSLEQIASKSGERLGLLRAFRRTEAQAARDPLTGLMNRRSLEESVHQLARQQIPFSVAYGDLDHFKELNDTHGHETGDRALRTFAQVLTASIRPDDLVARWGGEEFVMVLPRASTADCIVTLDRVRQALTQALQGASTPAFTVSFGVAQMEEGSLFADVLACADEALLRAKQEGRNRTIAWPDLASGIQKVSRSPRDPIMVNDGDRFSPAA
jgi:diguanylate cyclase (GGDEF)-like protein